jgi:hypothetical protein
MSTVVDKTEFVRQWKNYADSVRAVASGDLHRSAVLFPPRLEIRGTATRAVTGFARAAETTATRTTRARTRRPVVTFSALAMDVIKHDWVYDDGRESGCGLYGIRRDSGDVVVWALGRVRTDDRRTRVHLPLDELREDGAGYLHGEGWVLCGDAHVHPQHRDGGLRPRPQTVMRGACSPRERAART